jgi:N-acetylneuraminic acid mutarotase
VFDLSKEDGKWTEIAQPPFVTRALAAIGLAGKLYVMGGMHEDNGISKEVHIFDPKSNSWSKGPDLPGKDRLAGFAISAAVIGNKIYFNGSEGIVYSLAAGDTQFKPVERLLFPRSFHRLVAAPHDQLVVIAGVSRGGYLANVEVVDVSSSKPSDYKLSQWSVEFGGAAKHSQVLYVSGSSLYAFGGNRSRAPHDFSK